MILIASRICYLGLGWANGVPQFEVHFLDSTCSLFVCLLAFTVVIVLVLCLLSGALIASIEMFLHDRNGQKDLLLQLNMKITRPCAAVKREGLCFSLSGSTPHN